MNILITGAGGFIGTHLYNHLSKEHDITRIFSSNHSITGKNDYFVDLTKKTDVENLTQYLSKKRIDAIIHLASKMASTESIDDMSILKENVDMIHNMVFMLKKIKPEFIIHFSSMAVYPNTSGLFSEDSLPMPQKNSDCLYGFSKLTSEVILDFLLRKECIRIVHLRVAQVYGKGMRQDRIIPVMRKELKEKNTITVYGNGERQSCFIEIGKLVETVDLFIQNKLNGVFNVGDENKSYVDLAKTIIDQFGDQDSTIIMDPHGNTEKFNLDTSKLMKAINP